MLEARASIWDVLLDLLGRDLAERCETCQERLSSAPYINGDLSYWCEACERRERERLAEQGLTSWRGPRPLPAPDRAEVPRIARTAAKRGIDQVLL